jgi:hypothetical protein
MKNTKYLVALFLAFTLPVHADEPSTLRDLVNEIAVSFPRNELGACAKTHPEQADRFNNSAAGFSERIDKLLTEMASDKVSLLQPVPAEFLVFQTSLSALDDSDFRTRTLQECLNRIQEFDSLQDAELKAGMSETADSLSGTIRQYRLDMDRALEVKPTQ